MNIEKENDKIIMSDIFRIYYQEVIKIPLLSKEEERELLSKNDKESREKIIKANLRFVIAVARRYERQTISIMDLIQEGNLGLQFAVENYDIKKNVRFLTYAYYYIRKYILMYIMTKERKIKLPTNIREDIYRYKDSVNELYKILGRIPSFNEIANYMNLTEKRVKKIFFLLTDADSINSIIKDTKETKSEKEISNLLASSEMLEEQVFQNDFIEQLYKLINESRLTELEMEILILRYGLFNNRKLTQKEIAKLKNVSHQAVYDVERRALAKLRNSKKIIYIEDYLEKPLVKVKH